MRNMKTPEGWNVSQIVDELKRRDAPSSSIFTLGRLHAILGAMVFPPPEVEFVGSSVRLEWAQSGFRRVVFTNDGVEEARLISEFGEVETRRNPSDSSIRSAVMWAMMGSDRFPGKVVVRRRSIVEEVLLDRHDEVCSWFDGERLRPVSVFGGVVVLGRFRGLCLRVRDGVPEQLIRVGIAIAADDSRKNFMPRSANMPRRTEREHELVWDGFLNRALEKNRDRTERG